MLITYSLKSDKAKNGPRFLTALTHFHCELRATTAHAGAFLFIIKTTMKTLELSRHGSSATIITTITASTVMNDLDDVEFLF